jgi:tRNA modification GTPase
MHYHNDDTIVALATASGTGAISIIRISGPESIRIVDLVFKGKKALQEYASHTIHYGRIIDDTGELIDDVLVSIFRSPNSYTGEDLIEISTHASSIVVEKIISIFLNREMRLAEPGEFTKRAFLNNKLDLAQAEAVADIINSRTEASLRGARNQLDGILSSKVNFLREILINTSSLVELELDFAEEDLTFISDEKILSNLNKIETELNILLASYSFGKVIREGINVALVGKPNVGKSSLLNYLVKEARAIVSKTPGTTRDIIREDVTIEGILYKLFDTAGIRHTEDEIEKEGVIRSHDAVRNADVVLFMDDIDGFSTILYNQLLAISHEERILKVQNKIDLKKNTKDDYDVHISALTGEGIDKLFKKMRERAIGSKSFSEKGAIVSNLRHFQALNRARGYLICCKQSLESGYSGEFISVDLRNAESALGEIIGIVTNDDILNNIFSKFCVGK